MVVGDQQSKLDARVGRHGITRMKFNTLVSKIAKGFMNLMNSLFSRKIQVAGELHEKKGLPMLTGGQIHHVINVFFKNHDEKGRVIGLNDLLNIELRNDTLPQ